MFSHMINILESQRFETVEILWFKTVLSDQLVTEHQMQRFIFDEDQMKTVTARKKYWEITSCVLENTPQLKIMYIFVNMTYKFAILSIIAF